MVNYTCEEIFTHADLPAAHIRLAWNRASSDFPIFLNETEYEKSARIGQYEGTWKKLEIVL